MIIGKFLVMRFKWTNNLTCSTSLFRCYNDVIQASVASLVTSSVSMITWSRWSRYRQWRHRNGGDNGRNLKKTRGGISIGSCRRVELAVISLKLISRNGINYSLHSQILIWEYKQEFVEIKNISNCIFGVTRKNYSSRYTGFFSFQTSKFRNFFEVS